MLKTADFKEKERKLNDKIKALKADKRNLENLCKESEKLYCSKIQEQKKEIQNMQSLFKTIWPLIKNKVKDPTVLLSQINNGIEPVSIDEFTKVKTHNYELTRQLKHMQAREKQFKLDHQQERGRRKKMETSNRMVKKKY